MAHTAAPPSSRGCREHARADRSDYPTSGINLTDVTRRRARGDGARSALRLRRGGVRAVRFQRRPGGLTVGQKDARDGREGKAAVAEETEFAMGAEASCADGPGGKVTRVIIDPATKTVTHLVIEPKHRLGAGRLVPIDLVDATAD